jgi:hypothetical protein
VRQVRQTDRELGETQSGLLSSICCSCDSDMLCSDCYRIGLDADGANGLMTESFDFLLKDSYTLLKKSAEAGCDCCALVMESLETSERENFNRGGSIRLRRDGSFMFVKSPYIDDIAVHGGEHGNSHLRIFTTDGTVFLLFCGRQLTQWRG